MTDEKVPVGVPPAEGTYPVLPLRDIVVFPHMIVPLFVGREKSIKALEEVMRADKQVVLVTQQNPSDDEPAPDALYNVATLASVLQLLKLPDGTVKVLVEGVARVEVTAYTSNAVYYEAQARRLDEGLGEKVEAEALARSVTSEFENYVKLNKKISPEVVGAIGHIDDYAKLADTVASHLAIKIPEKQAILALPTVVARLERVLGLMESEISVLQVEKRIRSRVKRQMEKTQREYYLNEQMKAIQKELGDSEEGRDELAELEQKIAKTKFSKEAREKATNELKKLRQMSPMSAEATVVRNYLDWLLSIPWGKRSKVKNDLRFAQDVLDSDHYGLEKVKDRIVEYLAVQSRSSKVRGPILCLVGPPGVGKTSLGKSIAKATGREFVRMSLGGVRDEAEIRGHRRTYIGSMPGKVIQSMRKAKKSNPLFLLDEVDKIGMDFRGDPSSALLEVLDPEQNTSFNDHYLEVDYDLSNVLFITTANTLNIPPPLLETGLARQPEQSDRHLHPVRRGQAPARRPAVACAAGARCRLLRLRLAQRLRDGNRAGRHHREYGGDSHLLQDPRPRRAAHRLDVRPGAHHRRGQPHPRPLQRVDAGDVRRGRRDRGYRASGDVEAVHRDLA